MSSTVERGPSAEVGPSVEATPRPGHPVGKLSALVLLALASERVLALALIALLAALFGASVQSDAYFFALIVPTAIGTALGEGTYTALLQRVERSPERPISATARVALPSILGVAVVYVAVLLAVRPGHEAVWLAFSPVIVTLAFGSAFAAFLTVERRYSLAVLRVPLGTGLALAVVAVVLPFWDSVTAFAASMMVGYVASLAIFLALGRREPRGGRTGRLARNVTPVAVMAAAAPVAVATLVGGQFIIVVERSLAAGLAVGAVTLISLARGIALIPVQFAQALGNGVLPAAAEHYRNLEHAAVARLNLLALRLTMVTALVSATFLVICRRELVRIALQHGELNAGDAETTAKLAAILAVSLAGLSAGTVATKALYALGRQRFVAVVTAAGVIAYVCLAVVLRGLGGTTGLAWAFTSSALATGVLLTVWLARSSRLDARTVLRDWVVSPALLTVAFAAAGYAGWALASRDDGSVAAAVAAVAACGVAGLVALLAAAALFHQPEYELLRRLVRRLRGRLSVGRAAAESAP